jgi:hypothetical protein
MRWSSTFLFVLCCAGVFVVAAPAKEIERVVVCGATDCRTISGSSTQLEKIFVPTGAEVAARPGGKPFYTIDVYTGPHDPNHWQTVYMRDVRLLRSVRKGQVTQSGGSSRRARRAGCAKRLPGSSRTALHGAIRFR